MKRLALLLLLSATAFLLAGCPQTPALPVNPAECPVGPLAAPQALEPLRLQGMGRFEGDYVPGEVLAVPAPGLSLQALKAQVADVEPQEELPGGLVRLKVPVGQEKARAQALLKAGMRYVQPNYTYKPLKVPNDTYYSDQRVYLNGLVGLETAWDYSTGRACPPLVAVLDTGVLPHDDFVKGKYLPSGVKLDVANNDSDPTDRTSQFGNDAPFGHGLMVSTVLGADTNNAKGIAGVTWGGYIVPIKIMQDGGTDFLTSDIVGGLNLAGQLGARVVNLSFGGPNAYYDGAVAGAISSLRSAGAVIVAAAGNQAGPVFFPANLPGVIAVGAVYNNKNLASFSAYGPELDLVAPGVGVYVADPKNPRGYLSASGTSFASPIVAGVVALYMSKYASERKAWPTPDQVYTCLTGTAEDLGDPNRDDYYGFGLVRADRVMTDTTYCFP